MLSRARHFAEVVTGHGLDTWEGYRRLVLPFVGAVVIALATWWAFWGYTSSSLVQPNAGISSQGLGALANLAGQFGIATPLGGGPSPEFYSELATSDGVLRPVALRLRTSASMDSLTAPRPLPRSVVRWCCDGDTSARTIAKEVRDLRRKLDVKIDDAAGTLEFRIFDRNRSMAYRILREFVTVLDSVSLLAQADAFAQQHRSLLASAERARMELDSAEKALATFVERNRTFTSSPELTIKYQALQRRVNITEGVYIGVRQSVEQVRIAEERSYPALVVMSEPTLPVLPDKVALPVGVLSGLAFCGLALISWAPLRRWILGAVTT